MKAALFALLLLACGCVQDDGDRTATTETEAASTTATAASTTTSTTPATTTSSKATSSSSTTFCSTTTTMPWDADCVEYCVGRGYLGGNCQVNLLECQRRAAEAADYRGTLCSDRRFDFCCCKTNLSVDRDTCFAFDALDNKNL